MRYSRLIPRVRADNAALASAARAERGTWFRASVYPSSESAATVARRIARGMPVTYEPRGAFEAYSARCAEPEGTAVWVRCVEGGEYPSLPERMTVRVVHAPDGPGYDGLQVVTVSVMPTCPVCGGPRGLTVRPHRFRRDDRWYEVDRWDNPCGHIDGYAAVLAEARRTPPLPGQVPESKPDRPQVTGPYREVAALILTAAERRRGMRARAAALLAREHGHPEAAVLIERHIADVGGHMSAKQAAHYLATHGGPRRAVGSRD